MDHRPSLTPMGEGRFTLLCIEIIALKTLMKNSHNIPETFPALLAYRADSNPDEVVLRHKLFGIWQEVTWKKYLERVTYCCLGLLKLGLKSGDCVAHITENRPEWLYWEFGAMSAKLIPFGLYVHSENLEEIHYLLNYCTTKAVLCEDQEQVDKILPYKKQLPHLKYIIVIKDFELFEYDDPLLLSFKSLQQLGEDALKDEPMAFNRLVQEINETDIAFLSTTSGTTSRPKLAMLSYKNLITMAKAYQQIDPSTKDFEFFSFLPTAWIGERMTSIARQLYCGGFKINFPESADTALRDLREIGPHIIFSPPLLWEQLHTDVLIKVSESTFAKRVIYKILMNLALRIKEKESMRETVGLHLKIGYTIANLLVLRKIRDHLGLSKIFYLYTGGAAISTELFLFFLALGVRIKQAYGVTETGAIATVHRSDDIRLETTGQAVPGVEIKISDDGQILVKGDNVFMGYYNAPEKTEEALKDGWFYTGDKGYLDDDQHLIMIDRLGDVMTLSAGQEFSPQFIENKLKFSSFIKSAVVFGHGKPYVVALIQIDMNAVGPWAEKKGYTYTTFADLSQKKEVYEFIQKEIEKINNGIPHVAQVKRISLLEKELDPEDEELTETQKIRRAAISKKYSDRLAKLYDESGTGF
jgi:long-chain acyl-CoA synthetase